MENSGEEYIREIKQLIKDDELGKAEKKCVNFLEENPNALKIKNELARIYLIQNNPENALKILLEIYEKDHKNKTSLFLLGSAYEELQQFDDALKIFYEIEAIEQGSSYTDYRMAKIFENYSFDGRNKMLAQSYYQSSIKKPNPFLYSFLQLAKLEQTKRQLRILKQALEHYPESIEIYEALAKAYYKWGDFDDSIKIAEEAIKKNVVSSSLFVAIAFSHQALGEFPKALERIDEIDIEDHPEGWITRLVLFKSLLLIENKNFIEAVKQLKKIIQEDIDNRLSFRAHILLICVFLRQGKIDEAIDIYQEIPPGYSFNHFTDFFMSSSSNVTYLHEYIFEALEGIIQNGINSDAAVRAKGDYVYAKIEEYEMFLEKKASKKQEILALYEYIMEAHLIYPRNPIFSWTLGWILNEQKEWVDATYYIMLSHILANKSGDYIEHQTRPPFSQVFRSQKRYKKFLKRIDSFINKSQGYYKKDFSSLFLAEMVASLWKEKQYDRVIEVCEKFGYSELVDANVVFELAFSHVATDNRNLGKRYYEIFLAEIGENSAVLNNLGLLYLDDDLDKAEALFRKAADGGEEKAKENLERVLISKEETEKLEQTYAKAKDYFSQETKDNQELVVRIYATKTEDGIVYCNYNELSSNLKIPMRTLDEHIDDFLSKKYFTKLEDHVFSDLGVVLRINPYIQLLVDEKIETLQKEKLVKELAQNLSPSTLEDKFGYTQDLISNLSKISSDELAAMLQRDLREAVYALATGSDKSVLVLSGSIIEAVLLDRLLDDKDVALDALNRYLENKGQKIKRQNKKIENWSFELLLEISKDMQIISQTLYHLGNGLRGYRNLVHPGVEQRKQLNVTSEKATIAWSIVKELLIEID